LTAFATTERRLRSMNSKLEKRLIFAVLALAAVTAAGAAHAEGKLEAQYVASLAGIPIGKGSWAVDIGDTQYTAAASGMTTGLIKLFTGGRGSGAAQGTLSAGRPASSTYSATIKTGRHTDEVRMTVNGGVAKDIKIEPPLEPNPKRVPITDEHRHGVTDPMTASLLTMAGTGDLRAPQACERHLAVFDGKLRYDLKLAFKRMETVRAERGYIGPAVVCSVRFAPVAGFVPDRAAIKYLSESRDIEVWLAPIAGTRVMVPFRAQVATPFGLGVIEAVQFVSAPAGAKAAKTQ
jgi:hypothetical protein